MLNSYTWNLYLRAGGHDVVEMFKRNMNEHMTEEYPNEIERMRSVYSVIKRIVKADASGAGSVIDRYKRFVDPPKSIWYDVDDEIIFPGETLDEIYKHIGGVPTTKLQKFNQNLAFLSTFLTIEHPDRYVPYYFSKNYNVLEKIANEFGIGLPEIPLKENYKERFFHYEGICKVLLSFMEDNGLSPYELYAFLYDFAPNYIGGTESYYHKELPDPHAAYLIGIGAGYQRMFEKDFNFFYRCNKDAKAGDMIVMYLYTPFNEINYIGRVRTDCFIDPFDDYYHVTYMSFEERIEPFTLDMLRSDSEFNNLRCLRYKMRGVNGTELQASQYNHLLEKSGAQAKRLAERVDLNKQ